MKSEIIKPDIVEEEHLQFLDDLQMSGETNMFGATPYIQDHFNLSARDSMTILQYWMESFSQRHGNKKQ